MILYSVWITESCDELKSSLRSNKFRIHLFCKCNSSGNLSPTRVFYSSSSNQRDVFIVNISAINLIINETSVNKLTETTTTTTSKNTYVHKTYIYHNTAVCLKCGLSRSSESNQ